MDDLTIDNEQQAAVAILFACAMNETKSLSQSQIEHLSRMLVLSSKFSGNNLNDLTVKALSYQAENGSKILIERSAPFISEHYRETLFAMCCEIMTEKGTVNENESEILAMTALHLGLPVENMKMMLTTYLIRNRWNVQIIEP